MDRDTVKVYLDTQKEKVVELYDFDNKKVKYSEKIKGWKIDKFRGDEEVVRAYIIAHLVNDLGYKPENIEIEKQYDIGRPKVNKPRIDIIVRDDNGDAFLFIELKSPQDYEKDKDEVVEKQLYNLAAQEVGGGRKVGYLVLYTVETTDSTIKDKCILIDYRNFPSFDSWEEARDFVDAIPERYGKPQKEPYIKGGKKDLDSNFSHAQLDGLRRSLHKVLWGGGGTDDNDIFSSLVNIILAKIQDETERRNGNQYEFQLYAFKNGESIESNTELFKRINALYRRALKQRLGINDEDDLNDSFVIDRNKFSLSKLKYTVGQLEGYSFVEGKNSLDGKDILGDFFEGIIRDGFKQNKGQFFTHINVVKFLLWGLQLDRLAIERVNNDYTLPYAIDPSAGSGTFLIEYMKFITENVKTRFNSEIDTSLIVQNKMQSWFYPDNLENRWAEEFIYGSDINFNLGTATKVNMILHGDGSAHIYVKDGLLPFKFYTDKLSDSHTDRGYLGKDVNEKFDVVISNPPFSVDLDNETKKNVTREFIFGDKKNSENLFVERWYQLLKPNGRLGVVLPESIFDTAENKYIRLFIYKYFKVKAVVSLPELTFEPFTSTKTSLLFAQKKTSSGIQEWEECWRKYSDEWNRLKTRCENLVDVYTKAKDRNKYPSIKALTNEEEKQLLIELLKDIIDGKDGELGSKELVLKYRSDIIELCKFDRDTQDSFGFVNTWWVFSRVSQDLGYDIFMAEADHIGYKRTLRGERKMPNELYEEDESQQVVVDKGTRETILDYIRAIKWD